MTDIFREIEEDLRQEKLKKLWKQYGAYVVGLIVLIVAGVGGYQAWKAWDLERRFEQSNRYAAALQQLRTGNQAGAEATLTELAGSGSGYAVLARFEQAGLKAESGDLSGAIALWDQLARDGTAGPAFQGLATLLSVTHQIDSGDPGELEVRLRPLTAQGNPFRPSALELTAALALRAGDSARARELYTELADDRIAPAGLRTRAAQMLEALDG
ncbi:MAG: tetratricopeptide repeat protein [Kiloniellales bacterium]